MEASPPTKRRKRKENVSDSEDERKAEPTAEKLATPVKSSPASDTSKVRQAFSTASLASAVSVGTAFQRAAVLTDCSNLQPSQRLEDTTSPRQDSSLARRPKEHFPCSLQPFRVVPAPSWASRSLSVAEVNRRIQQAQALADRQQSFDQLIDLASDGFLPERHCGDAPAIAVAQAAQAAPVAPPVPQPSSPLHQAAGPVAVPVAAVQPPCRLVGTSRGTTLPSRSGRGSIRILKLQ